MNRSWDPERIVKGIRQKAQSEDDFMSWHASLLESLISSFPIGEMHGVTVHSTLRLYPSVDAFTDVECPFAFIEPSPGRDVATVGATHLFLRARQGNVETTRTWRIDLADAHNAFHQALELLKKFEKHGGAHIEF